MDAPGEGYLTENLPPSSDVFLQPEEILNLITLVTGTYNLFWTAVSLSHKFDTMSKFKNHIQFFYNYNFFKFCLSPSSFCLSSAFKCIDATLFYLMIKLSF